MAKIIKRKKTIPYNFAEKHLAYIRACEDAIINVAEGAVRAGKTVDNVIAFCHELKTTPDKIHLASASTAATAKLNLGDCNGFGIEYYFRGQCRWGKYKGNEALIIKGADTGYKTKIVIFAGAALANSFKKIRGNSYGMWIGTEINLHHDSFIKEAFNRQLAAKRRKIFWDLNPDNPNAAIYTEYIDKYKTDHQSGKLLGGYNYQHFTIHDNINIPEQNKAEFISQYDPSSIWYLRDIMGQRCVADGLIFRQFADNPERFILDTKPKNIKYILLGVDFGGNKSKTTFVASAIIGDWEQLVVVDDHKVEGGKGEINPVTIETDFIAFVKRVQTAFPHVMIAYAFCDNEAQTLINGIRVATAKAGIPVRIADCFKAAINDRIAALTMLMTMGRFFVLRHCKNVIGSLKSQIWDSKQKTADVRLDDGTCDIDTADALEYTFSKFINYFLKDVKANE